MQPPYNPSAAPVINPNEVKGFVAHDERRPTRYFYVLYGEIVWELDGYRIGEGDKAVWNINLICPKCRQNLLIDSTKKPILIDEKGIETGEPIQCSHPGEFGGLCRFRVVLEPPRRREDKEVEIFGRKIRIDAVARDA